METPDELKVIAIIVGMLGCYILGFIHGVDVSEE